jgi:hypothetical protein
MDFMHPPFESVFDVASSNVESADEHVNGPGLVLPEA